MPHTIRPTCTYKPRAKGMPSERDNKCSATLANGILQKACSIIIENDAQCSNRIYILMSKLVENSCTARAKRRRINV